MDPVGLLESHANEFRALGAKRIGVFGSFARGDYAPESDVDIYVEFDEPKRTFRNFNAIYDLLESIFQRRIDLVTDGALNERKAQAILPTVRYAPFSDPAPAGHSG